MMFLLFQLLDILTAVVLVMGMFGFVNWNIFLYHGTYLVAKGAWYWQDWMSWIDILVGVWILLMMLGARHAISYVFAVWFLYKASMWFVLKD